MRSHPKLDRPIFVTGTPRSGKSLVCKSLRRAAEVEIAREPISIWDDGFGSRPSDCRGPEDADSRAGRRILQRCSEVVSQGSKQRYLDDLAYHALRIPFLATLVPDARVVHIINRIENALPEMLHGWTYKGSVGQAVRYRRKNLRLATLPRLGLRFLRNYWLSHTSTARASWGPRVPGQSEFAAAHSVAELAAFQWKSMIEIAQRDAASNPNLLVLEVRYDRLVADPESEIRRVADFCEIDDPAPVVARALELVDPAFESEGKRLPTQEEWAAIRELVAPLQQSLGYWTEDDRREARLEALE